MSSPTGSSRLCPSSAMTTIAAGEPMSTVAIARLSGDHAIPALLVIMLTKWGSVAPSESNHYSVRPPPLCSTT